MLDLNLPKKRILITRAPIWKRILSFFLDVLFLDLLYYGLFKKYLLLPSLTMEQVLSQQINLPAGFYLATISIGIITLVYFTLFTYYFAQTLGMKLLGLYVGGERTIMKCVIRNLYLLPFFPFTLFWLVEPFYLIFKKERLLEKWSKTTTIEQVRM